MRHPASWLATLLLCLGAALLAAVPAAASGGLVPIPPLAARVTDLTGTLDAGQKSSLESRLGLFEVSKGAQVVVLIVPTTQPESIEQFAIRVLDAWRIGRKGIDDGVILLVARDDRRLRIEVGYGLEGVLNDATAKRIIAETITPRFQTGDLPGGISAGVDAILKVVAGEPLPPPPAERRPPAPAEAGGFGEHLWVGLLFAVAFVGNLLRLLLGNFLGAGLAGLICGGIGWLLFGSVAGVVIGALAGVFLALFGLELLMSGGGSLRGSGGGRGGGFSGGGGAGGGGGASGRW